MLQRRIYQEIWAQLSRDKPMVFLAGPRQSGKTTFALKTVAPKFKDTVYFNWDIPADKQKIISDPDFFTKTPRKNISAKPLVIFDEIHKYRHWKNYLKGIYDAHAAEYHFLVTGSGRLEFSRKAGDSLAGRFLKFHLFPLTLAELSSRRLLFKDFVQDPLQDTGGGDSKIRNEALHQLDTLSGFPEPFLQGRRDFWNAWSASYGQQMVRDDLRSVADIRNLDQIETLFSLIPSRVGSPFSINSLARDLGVSFDTVKNWLMLFDAFYLTFRIPTWTRKISRGILKEKKVYFFNLPVIQGEGARFENLAALELLRAVESWNDQGFGRFGLYYLRNKEKEEVDFLLTRDQNPWLLVEAKVSDEAPSRALFYYQGRLNVPAVQVIKKAKIKKYYTNGQQKILVVSAADWFSGLP